MKPRNARAILVVASVAIVAALALLEDWPTPDVDAAPPEAGAQVSTGEEPLPDFKPSERLPADSAVAFPTDI